MGPSRRPPAVAQWVAALALALGCAPLQANPAGGTQPVAQPSAQAAPAERQAKPPSKAEPKPKAKPKAKTKTKAKAKSNRQKTDKSVEPAKKAKAAAAGALIGTGAAYAERAPAMQFAAELAERRQLPPDWVRQVLGQAHHIIANRAK